MILSRSLNAAFRKEFSRSGGRHPSWSRSLLIIMTRRVHGHGRDRAKLAILVLIACAFWIMFVGSFSLDEMLVGLMSVAATVIFTLFVSRRTSSEFTFRGRDLAEAWRIPWYVLSGVWDITLVLVRDVLRLSRADDLYRVCGFDSSKHDPVRKSRTVLAVAYTTAAPNFIVLGVDVSHSRMLFHQISASSVPKMTKALGAKA
jgi:multisubunit Na+/H+ antiporter MnhE subunit